MCLILNLTDQMVDSQQSCLAKKQVGDILLQPGTTDFLLCGPTDLFYAGMSPWEAFGKRGKVVWRQSDFCDFVPPVYPGHSTSRLPRFWCQVGNVKNNPTIDDGECLAGDITPVKCDSKTSRCRFSHICINLRRTLASTWTQQPANKLSGL